MEDGSKKDLFTQALVRFLISFLFYPLFNPFQNRGQDPSCLARDNQVRQIIVRGRIPVDNHQAGAAPFGRQRQGGGRLHHQGRTYDDKKVGGG